MLVANAVNSLPGQLIFLRVVRCISLINDKRHIPEINIAFMLSNFSVKIQNKKDLKLL